jgi:hypothetical protein
MNDMDLDRILDAWLDLGPNAAPDRVAAAARHEARSTRQTALPRWWPSWRRPIMRNNLIRYGVISAAAIGLAVAGWRLLPTTNVGPAPSVHPTASPIAITQADIDRPLSPGRYSFDVGPQNEGNLTIDLSLPTGWRLDAKSPGQVVLGEAGFIGFYSVSRVYADPCHPETGVQPRIGQGSLGERTVGDALASMQGFTTSYVATESVGGLQARHYTITNQIDTDTAGCTDGALLPLFVTTDADYQDEMAQRTESSPATNGGTSHEVWVVTSPADLGGHFPLLIVIDTPETPGEGASSEVLASLVFRQPGRAPFPSTDPTSGPTDLTSDRSRGPLAAGRYSFRIAASDPPDFVTVELTVPEGWRLAQHATSEAAFVPDDAGDPYVGFFGVRDVYRDPCHPERGTQGGSSLGPPTAADIADDLQSMAGFTSTPPVEESLGIHFTISNEIRTDSAGCSDGGLLPLFVTREAEVSQELRRRTEHSPATNGGTSLDIWVPRPTVCCALRGGLVIVTESSGAEDQALLDQVISSITIRN